MMPLSLTMMDSFFFFTICTVDNKLDSLVFTSFEFNFRYSAHFAHIIYIPQVDNSYWYSDSIDVKYSSSSCCGCNSSTTLLCSPMCLILGLHVFLICSALSSFLGFACLHFATIIRLHFTCKSLSEDTTKIMKLSTCSNNIVHIALHQYHTTTQSTYRTRDTIKLNEPRLYHTSLSMLNN